MRGARLLKRLGVAMSREIYQTSYSQCGEDCIVRNLLTCLDIPQPTYLDIGAHHPSFISNTYHFYQAGSSGVCIEPDPTLCQGIKAVRTRDVCLNIGIAGKSGEGGLTFYVFDPPTMNTFSPTERDAQLKVGLVLKQELQIEVISINKVIAQNFPATPNFVSLDTEGMDLAILETLDFKKYRPEVFCIETLTNIEERKMSEILDFMKSQQYVIYADTYLNTIFVEGNRWAARLAERRKLAA